MTQTFRDIPSTSRHSHPTRKRSAGALTTIAVAAGLALGGLLALAPAVAADAATPRDSATSSVATAAATTGWVRLAHLSPDTAPVDIRLTALAGGSLVTALSDIGYGAVSPYMALNAGTYVVSMAPTGSDFAQPVIQASVTVVAGQPLTVAALGKNAGLQAAVYQDDLSAPGVGQAKVRVVQASTVVPSVSVATSTGSAIAGAVAEGVATSYVDVPAGRSTLDLTSQTVSSKADVQLDAGSVSTLFVLDTSTGGLALKAVLDSATAGSLPTGGVQTGGGGTATVHTAALNATAAQPAASQQVATRQLAAAWFEGRTLIDTLTAALCLIVVTVVVVAGGLRARANRGEGAADGSDHSGRDADGRRESTVRGREWH